MHWRDYQRMQRVAEIGDRFISYVDEGRGEPVVLLHGIPTWGFLWHPLLEPLASDFRVLIPDLPGFGYSDRSDRFDRSIARQAERIDGWLESLGIGGAAIVGHDIGGGIALRLATLSPHRVRSLVLVDSVCYDSWPIAVLHKLGLPDGRRKLDIDEVLDALRDALKMGFAAAPEAELLDGLLAPCTTEVGKVSMIRNASALDTNLTAEVTPFLSRITAPTLVLWGQDDEFQPLRYGERLAWDIPGARLERIETARHFVMLDQPGEVARALVGFLRH